MKKIISILALVLAMTMVMSVSAFAAKEFGVDEAAAAAEGVTLGTVDADSIEVTVPTTDDADYSILLVKGSTLPTVDSDIAYINQIKADAATETFEVLPLMSVAEGTADGNLMLYIGTNATDENLISIPVTYAESAPANDYITSADTSKGTIATDAASVTQSNMGAVCGNAIISLALDTTAYPNAGTATAGYIVKAVNADGTDITGATVYYSKERAKYVALIPSTVTDYKFEVIANGTEGAVTNDEIVMYGNMNEDSNNNMKQPADLATFKKIYLGSSSSAAISNPKKALLADVTGDGKFAPKDLAEYKKAYLGSLSGYTFAVLNK